MVRVKNTSAILSLAGAISIIAVPVRADETPQPAAQVPVQADAVTPAPASPTPAKAAEQGATETLGQVVVTAQKREQKLQDVPIAVTAITAKELESRGIQDIADLSALSPGLQVEKSPANGSISQVAIRGNVQINPAIYWDTAVGVYMDGVYLGKSQGSVFDVVDLNRVEVLRGPQGTLYGRNTIGGAINLVTRKPTGVFGGDASVSAGNYGSHVEKLSLDLPKVSIASISLGVISDRRDGWVNTTPGSSTDNLNNRGNTGLRLAANFALTRDLQADYRFDKTNIDENGEFGQLYSIDSGFSLYPALAPYASKDRQTTASVDAPSFENVHTEGHSLTLTWNAGGNNTLKSISAYRHLDSRDAADYDGSPTPVAATQRLTKYHQVSQELQWVGHLDRWNYVGGLYYFHDDGYTNNPQTFFFGGAQYDSQYGTRTDAWAPYGQVDYKVLDNLTLTAGVRYTEELKALDRIFGYCTGPACATPGGYQYLIPQGTHAFGRFEAFTPSFTAAYKVSENLNTYFRFAEGFKSGGFNGEFSDVTQTSEANITETKTPFQPEKQITFELGEKSSYFGGKAELNAAMFLNNVRNLQESIFTGNGAASSTIRNAGQAIVRGIELEGAVTPVRGTRLSANYAYLDAHYNSFRDADQQVKDNRAFVHAPRNTFNLVADSKFLRTSWGTFEALADYAYTTSYYLYPYQLSGPGAQGYDKNKQVAGNTRVKSYGLLNLRLALNQIPLGSSISGDVAVWARNVTNEAVATNLIDFGPGFGSLTEAYFNDPRTFGITGTVHF
ncbi:TonB-dependent receptor [Nevskia soli]|uniref:TonB-dependent receptor n=1 Tax=Nevskia soli TaxID=418856 RepID=UPI00068A0302|nr:TonB-dependent receptor [Nevskia soli]